MAGLVLVCVEGAEVLPRFGVEAQPRDRLTVVVIEQDGEVALGVAVGDPLGFDFAARDRLDHLVSLQLFQSGLDPIVAFQALLRRFLTTDRLQIFGLGACCLQRLLQPAVDLVLEEGGGGLLDKWGELLTCPFGEGAIVDPAGEELHPFVLGFLELLRQGALDRTDVLEFLGGVDHRFQVEGGLGQLT